MISRIEEVRAHHGTKPFFIYDLDAMKSHLARLKIPGVQFWYATKANPLSAVVKTAYESGFGIDCASSGEFRQALRAGVPANRILLTGPAKSKALITEALELGLETFVLESVSQALDLEMLATKMNRKVNALLRLQLHWNNGEKSVLGGSSVSPFGLDAEGWKALKLSDLKNVHILGVHCFQWGNILDADRLAQIWKETAARAIELSKSLNFSLRVLDLGGGLGIPYHGEAELEYSLLEQNLKSLKSELPKTEIWMELGRYAIGPFGKYVTEVIDQKHVADKNFLVTEGGVHHLVRPALIKEAFPATLLSQAPNVNNSSSRNEETLATSSVSVTFQVHGPLCTALDHLGAFDFPSGTGKGDVIVFHQCGAYGFTESMPYFLCHDLPAEFVLKDQKLTRLRDWQKPEQWLV